MGGSEEDVWHRVMRLRHLAAGAILLPFCFLKLERWHFYIKKNGKIRRKFRERSQGVYGVCCEKIVLSIYDHYQRVTMKFAISELHFSRG